MNKKKQISKYVIADAISAILAWMVFFLYRKYSANNLSFNHFQEVYTDQNFYLGLIIIPFFWVILYIITGTYRKIYRKSRLRELSQTILITIIGVIFIFFAIILDDVIVSYKSYYQSFFVLYILHLFFTFSLRLIITTSTINKIQKKIIGFNTIIVGSGNNAFGIYQDIENQEKSAGNKFLGFISIDDHQNYKLAEFIKPLGKLDNIKETIQDFKVEEVIIAVERSEQALVEKILTLLEECDVVIKIIPNLQDFLMGSVKTTAIWHAPLILVSPDLMPPWQQSLKRIMDILVSLFCMLLLSPLYLFTALMVKFSSKGPVIFAQERVGLHGKPFVMYKFRSMFTNAENDGPQLSSKDDRRITPFGKYMRKVRLDEIPQFYSVFKGDMSLVGPRPERQYFIDQIVQVAPHYKLLHKVKPGITSWGQVKFGYASNLDEMVERLKYDILYIENMSIAMDFKILIYTVLIIVQGRGK